MSSDDAPSAPQHKLSSTSFVDVFKTLGVGRPKSHSPVSLQESNNDQTTDSRGNSRLVLGFESMHRGSVVSSSSDTPSGPDFDASLRILSNKQNLAQAVEEAEALSRTIPWFSAEQSMVLWEAAEYLLHHEHSGEAQRSGGRLLEAIAARQDLSPSSRRVIFEAIACPTDPELVASRVQSLVALSDHGRKLDFTSTSILHIIASWVMPLYDTLAAARNKAKRVKAAKPNELSHYEAVLEELFQFAEDLITLQRKPPTQEEISLLLTETITVCKKTSVASDIKNSLAVFEAIIDYANVPDASFIPLLEVLCSIHASVKSLSGPTSRTVRSLAKSRRQEEMVNTLHTFMRESCAKDQSRNLNVLRGTIYVFSDLVRDYGQNGMPQISFGELVDSLLAIAQKDEGKVDADVLDLCLSILEGNFVRVALACDWSSFVELLLLCSRRVFDEPEDSVSSPTSPPQHPVKNTPDDTRSHIVANTTRIASAIEVLWEQLTNEQKQQSTQFLMRGYAHIEPSQAELIINHMRHDKICYPSEDSSWVQHCQELIERFIQPRKQSSDIRIMALDTLKEALSGNDQLLFAEEHGLLDRLLQDFSAEHDLLFLESLVSFITEPATQVNDSVFKRLVDTISSPMANDLHTGEHREISPNYNSSRRTSTTSLLELTLSNVCAVSLVKMMLRALNHSGTKSVIIFEALLQIAQSSDRPTDSRLTVLKLLFRLRCDSAGSVTVVSTSEGDFLMNVLGRNVDVAGMVHTSVDSPTKDVPHDALPPLANAKIPSKEPSSSLSSKSAPRGSISARSSKLTAPVWTHSLPQVLPEQPPGESSRLVFAYTMDGALDPPESMPAQVGVLKVNMWLEIVIALLQRETDWDVYSYLLTHLGPQLANKDFFNNSIPQVKLLRSILCDQSDVAACIFDALCMLVSYHEHFAKSEEDDLVRAFMSGIIGSWGATSRGCIQALSLCCHEIPMSVTKSLMSILDRMAKVITMSNIAVHILEFLALLARLPEVYVNLREEEIRTVFGICIRFLQTTREQRYRSSDSHSQDLVLVYGNMPKPPSPPTQDVMSSYVMTLTYNVMVFWFLSLKLQDRARHVNWITSRLIFRDDNEKEVVEEQSQVFIDLMQRVAFSDLGETIPFETFPPTPEDGPVLKKSWAVGMSLVTVETAGASGLTQITKRQASGTTYSVYQQRTAPVLPHQVPATVDAHLHSDSTRTAILPSHIMLQMTATAFPTPTVMQPIPIPEDDITRRAISSFDRIDIVDGHKIGVVYVDNGQNKEAEILANTGGSADYEHFLSGLGFKVSLRNAQFNTQGLYADTDGEATYAWRDRVTEIVYHVATMMPTDFDRDPTCINKKRNIGNNFVTIVFNRSNLPFNFDTIPSQFNSINILITPSSNVAYDESGSVKGETDPDQLYYSVQVMSKPGFPDVSPAATPKVISGRNLAPFVRILALNASVFSLVYNTEGGEHASSWRTRLREIKKVRERALAAQAQGSEASEGAYPGLRRNTKASIFSEETPIRTPPAKTDSISEWTAASDTNILQNLDFSRWSR
ncbi:hypothetical protein N7448_008429 [Penicillium atrosanguineum]|nr:hypothetical protein N7448_008429 [Penicillium atrosanguineum]